MTSEDDLSLSEEDMDEIVNRVVDQLSQAGVGGEGDDDEDHEIEIRTGEESAIEVEEGDDHEDPIHAEDERVEGEDERVDDEARRRRGEAREREREAKRRAREARRAAEGLEDLGDRIEAAVEARLNHLGEHLEHALGPGPTGPPEPTVPGVVIGPDDTREKAVYKTQLQKGGRVAVPDTEIEALDLDPGDTLQVVLYPVE